ncbi:MAG TPA: glycoside hydrolase family 16 protein [Nevskiaceae bacterium]|nr:glycoside hydrolase family 16 protein [Nevskiaceae bacterium]
MSLHRPDWRAAGVALAAALCACGGGGSDATPVAPVDLGPPTWSKEFANGNGVTPISSGNGSVTFGAAGGADDGNAASLLFPGDSSKGPNARAGTGYASEIDSVKGDFHYGEYRARLRLATCAPTEELVNGYFTYFHDGNDYNGNGIADNSEIDIEIQCGRPYAIFLTSWTDYDSETSFRKWTRVIDTSTGDIWESVADDQFDIHKIGNDPAFLIPGFPDANTFYEMGFDWEPDHIRWFLVNGGQEITLWNFTNAQLVPNLPATLIFNLWHANSHWFAGGSAADYPAADGTLTVDWARYWQQ